MKIILKTVLIILLILIGLALAALVCVKISGNHRSDPAMVRSYDTNNPFITGSTQISAHRSGGGIAPEETLMAFRNCVENPEISIDVLEFDLHITADEQLVLLHDDTLDRTSDSVEVFGETDVRPENKTLAELKLLNMGAKFIDSDGNMPYSGLEVVPDALRILSLPEVLDYLTGVGEFHYIIEVKNDGELGRRAVDILYDELATRGLLERTAFGTFSDEIAAYVKREQKKISMETPIDIQDPINTPILYQNTTESVEKIVLNRDERNQLKRAIDSLEDTDRIIIWMAYYQEMSLAEIADILNMSLGAVKMRKKRALNKLRKNIGL